MATSAFKSTTKRTPIDTKSTSGDSSVRSHRRSRSLSRFSRPDSGETPRRSGRFVNTVRGSEFPEISLDELAAELFSSSLSDERVVGGGRRFSEAGDVTRGRSATRGGEDGKGSVGSRRRSVSAVRCPVYGSESERDQVRNSNKLANSKSISNGNRRTYSGPKPTATNHRGMERSLSQKELPRIHDGYSSHSSALTDDEARDNNSARSMTEKTIRTVYAKKKSDHPTGDNFNGGLYEAMKIELRHAVDEIKTELEQATVRKTPASESSKSSQLGKSLFPQPAATTKKHQTSKIGKIDKRKDDLLAEFLLEEQCRREPSSAEKPSRTRKRSKDRTRISSRLAEEAEKYFEDFFSNFEDTDVSSFDGERSETSSTFGPPRTKGELFHFEEVESYQCSAIDNNPNSVEMEGVILPWLGWETINDGSSHPLTDKKDLSTTPKSIPWDVAEEMVSAPDRTSQCTSSSGSWNPEVSSNHSKGNTNVSVDMDRYLHLQKDEELILDTWRERHRINSGSLLLCNSSFMYF